MYLFFFHRLPYAIATFYVAFITNKVDPLATAIPAIFAKFSLILPSFISNVETYIAKNFQNVRII